MSMLRKSIHHSQDDTLSMHPWKPLNEVKSYVCPHMRRYLQGLQEAGWSEGFHEIGRASCRERVLVTV